MVDVEVVIAPHRALLMLILKSSWSAAYVFSQGSGALWCDVDIVEVSYYGQQTGPQPEQTYAELVERIRGIDPHIGSGTQVR